MALTEQQTAQLERLRNHGTRYEVTLSHRDRPSILIGYTGRKSFSGLLAMVRQQREHIVRVTGAESVTKAHANRCQLDNGWFIHFSGRTQREAITNGERPFIRDIDRLDY